MGITEARTYLVCQSFYFKAKSVDKFKPVGGEKSVIIVHSNEFNNKLKVKLKLRKLKCELTLARQETFPKVTHFFKKFLKGNNTFILKWQLTLGFTGVTTLLPGYSIPEPDSPPKSAVASSGEVELVVMSPRRQSVHFNNRRNIFPD